MAFRERAVEIVKAFGQELIDRADELVPCAKRVERVNIWINIPTLSERVDFPTIEVTCELSPERATMDLFTKKIYLDETL